jgi:hypothetical protein
VYLICDTSYATITVLDYSFRMRGLPTRRALSSIATGAILITATAMMGTGLVNWSNSNLNAFETALVTTSSTMTNRINENISIENIVFCVNCGTTNSKNVINVTLTNTGTIPVSVAQIQVNSTAIKSYFGTATLPATISPKGSYLVSATLSSPTKWKSHEPDTITVTTTRGTIFTTQAAPS